MPPGWHGDTIPHCARVRVRCGLKTESCRLKLRQLTGEQRGVRNLQRRDSTAGDSGFGSHYRAKVREKVIGRERKHNTVLLHLCFPDSSHRSLLDLSTAKCTTKKCPRPGSCHSRPHYCDDNKDPCQHRGYTMKVNRASLWGWRCIVLVHNNSNILEISAGYECPICGVCFGSLD